MKNSYLTLQSLLNNVVTIEKFYTVRICSSSITLQGNFKSELVKSLLNIEGSKPTMSKSGGYLEIEFLHLDTHIRIVLT